MDRSTARDAWLVAGAPISPRGFGGQFREEHPDRRVPRDSKSLGACDGASG
jgi:hypothetical protein